MKIRSRGDQWFDAFNVFLMLAVVVLTLAPFWFALVGSLNQGIDYMRGGVYLWPREFTLANYMSIFSDNTIYHAYFITVSRSLIGTILHVAFTALVAYGMSRKALAGRNVYLIIMLFTMFFYGGLIPTYLLYKKLGLLNNFLVYIVPTMFSVWDMIIIMSFFRTIPESIVESAKIDGAGEYRIFLQLVLPLTKPVLAAIALFNCVYHWNAYTDALFFTTKDYLEPVQLFLKRIVTDASVAQKFGEQVAGSMPEEAKQISSETLKLAMMMATTAPILIVYPFLQRFFVKGVLIGSVKG
ncbi:carbohydrate ABC transporter permease [Paenibacillus sp. HWE-109]|uniref:carbohydrate ABC transporter permease n=1 Tax=Paenibacillus sp. HWE-109 TaxID=1306526 RepID=UPI001EDD6631|nr:carbohydrate ABC transporter permease [Paenibacillus sp. HWE-109]UKS26890.1 carbohydrate ABC transporter permease [Paenibacillus sp. HWE-109]